MITVLFTKQNNEEKQRSQWCIDNMHIKSNMAVINNTKITQNWYTLKQTTTEKKGKIENIKSSYYNNVYLLILLF